MNRDVSIRKLDEAQVDVAIEWAAAEDWNPGLNDRAAFFAADPNGFHGLFVGDELTVTISVVQYDARFGFLGFYICRPDRRGEGFGLQLFEHALTNARPTTIGLDGVVAQEHNYGRSGFVTAHRNVRFGGRPQPLPDDDAHITRVTGDHIDRLTAYERAASVFPAPRPQFLEPWITATGTFAAAIEGDATMKGYGVIRPCRSGYKIGPLFCVDRSRAEQLIAALITAVGTNDEIFLDVPQPNTAGMELAHALGLEPVFETVRMYRGPDPGIALQHTFGVTSFELG